jgi:hypothetical protein
MIRAIAESAATVAATALLIVAGNWIDFTFCAEHRAWERHAGGAPQPIRPGATMVARPGDAIYACTTQHCFGGMFDCHEDLGCYCAAGSIGSDALGRFVSGSCVVDAEHPSRSDVTGVCPHARCDEQVGR